MTLLVNIMGLVLIGFIIWWFWLAKPKAKKASRDETITIIVEGGAYDPARIEVAANKPVQLTFIRKDASPCAAQVVFGDLDISHELSMDSPTRITLPTLKPGEYEFTCQMGMYRGSLRVTA